MADLRFLSVGGFLSVFPPLVPAVRLASWEKGHVVVLGVVYAAVQLFLAVDRAAQYASMPLFVRVAKAAGVNCNFHAALLLLTIMGRRVHFLVSASPLLSRWAGLDFTVPMHSVVGKMNTLWCLLHVAAWMVNYARMGHMLEYMFTTRMGQGWVGGLAGLTGVTLTCLLAVIVAGYALRHLGWKTKRDGRVARFVQSFEVFQVTHRLVYVYAVVMLLHAPTCLYWLAFPLSLCAVEWFFRTFQSYTPTHPVFAELLPGGVTELTLARPTTFQDYKAGSFGFLCVPAVSYHEWHPFTLSSSGLRKDKTISFHIRAVSSDSWTGKLREYVRHHIVAARRADEDCAEGRFDPPPDSAGRGDLRGRWARGLTGGSARMFGLKMSFLFLGEEISECVCFFFFLMGR